MRWMTLVTDMLPFMATISPLIGAASLAVSLRQSPQWVRLLAIFNASLTLLLLVIAVWSYDPRRVDQRGRADVSQMKASLGWLEQSRVAISADKSPARRGIDVRLSFGIDGLTVWPTVWIAMAAWAAIVVSAPRTGESSVAYCLALLVGEACLLASLTSRDAIVSLISFEMAIPALSFLIGRYGGRNRRATAGRFLANQLVGFSLTLLGTTLIAVSWPWVRSDFDMRHSPLFFDTFNLVEGIQAMVARNEIAVQLWSDLAPWGCVLLVVGLAIRLPAFPFHSWYVTTLEDAPEGVAGLVAIALPQVAFCGWIRFAMPLFAEQAAELSWLLGIVTSVGALHSGLRALSQSDLKRFAAAVSMGWISLALVSMRLPAREGLTGAWLLLQSQGLTVTGLFLLFDMMQSRPGARESDVGEGLVFRQPRMAMMLIALLACMGTAAC